MYIYGNALCETLDAQTNIKELTKLCLRVMKVGEVLCELAVRCYLFYDSICSKASDGENATEVSPPPASQSVVDRMTT